MISYFASPVGLGCRSGGFLIFGLLTAGTAIGEDCIELFRIHNSKLRHLAAQTLLLLESVNVCWLEWITLAEMFGFHQTCRCRSTTYSTSGGYIRVEPNEKNEPLIHIVIIWIIDTGLAGRALVCSLAYIVGQWCMQSHIMTEDCESARRGLHWTGRLKEVGLWLLCMPHVIARGLAKLLALVAESRAVRNMPVQ